LAPLLASQFSVSLHTNEAPFHCVKDVLLCRDEAWLEEVEEMFDLRDEHYDQFRRALDGNFDAVVLNFNWDLCFPAYKMDGKYVPLLMADRLSHVRCESNIVWTNRKLGSAMDDDDNQYARSCNVQQLEFFHSLDLDVLMNHIQSFRTALPPAVHLVLVNTPFVSDSSLYAPLYNDWVPVLKTLLNDVASQLPNTDVIDLTAFPGTADGDGMHYSRQVNLEISEQVKGLLVSR